jgi:hypothetical protein
MAEFEKRDKKYKLAWQESENGPFSTAYADDFEIKDGCLWFYAARPIVLSTNVKFIIK